MRATHLAIDGADAALAGQLNSEHKDPFDSLIIARANRYGLTVARSDSAIADSILTPVLKVR